MRRERRPWAHRAWPGGARALLGAAAALVLLSSGATARAQNRLIVAEDVDAQGNGYTVLKVWGTPYQMGWAQGATFPEEIVAAVEASRQIAGANYALLRSAIGDMIFEPADFEPELQGMLDAVLAANPGAGIDLTDLKAVNTFGDWSYACRSHSTWGSFVSGRTRTLSTRRLDFSVIPGVTQHHVLLARQPSSGVRWVNLAWPGFIASVTGVNEYGTLASLHDYLSYVTPGAHVPRSLLPRWALTLVDGLPPEQHLDAVFTALQSRTVMTGTFLNYYVPEGHGGVITCANGQVCSRVRVPQPDFFNGEVLLTSNSETDGHSAPSDDTAMAAYYASGGTKTLADHYGLMGHYGLHLMSVDFRGRGDMTVWFEGRTSGGVFPTVQVEWSQLFGAPPDAGVPAPRDAGMPPRADAGRDAAVRADAAVQADAAGSVDAASLAYDGGGGHDAAGQVNGPQTDPRAEAEDDPQAGCGCGSPGEWSLLAVFVLPAAWRAARRRRGERS